MNAENQTANNSQSSEIFHRSEIAHTPFCIIEYPNEVFLALGKYKIKRQHPNGEDYSNEDYRQLVLTRDWNLLLDIIGIFIEQSK